MVLTRPQSQGSQSLESKRYLVRIHQVVKYTVPDKYTVLKSKVYGPGLKVYGRLVSEFKGRILSAQRLYLTQLLKYLYFSHKDRIPYAGSSAIHSLNTFEFECTCPYFFCIRQNDQLLASYFIFQKFFCGSIDKGYTACIVEVGRFEVNLGQNHLNG